MKRILLYLGFCLLLGGPLRAAGEQALAAPLTATVQGATAGTVPDSGLAPGLSPAEGVNPLTDAPELLSPTSALLEACMGDYNRLDFARAESEAAQAMALQPDHPLPAVYLQGALTAEIQDQIAAGHLTQDLLKRFDLATVHAVALDKSWELVHHDAWGQIYIGDSLGARGLVDMYRGRLMKAYSDGKLSADAMRLAQKRMAGENDSDLGLGQYMYYCGRLSGVLRMFLVLHGDIPGGIAKLRNCGAAACRSAPLARLVLARILSEDMRDYDAALPYVQEAYGRYPLSWDYAKLAMEEAQGLGLQRPEARALAETLRAQWQAGWR
ncbi:MAG TPA: hypothetical protein VNZ67_12805, partial [bacterium]|nr:hypothetical protein [bacterium]